MLKKIQYLFSGIFILIGLFVGVVSLKGLYYSYQASSWVVVPGTIKEVKFIPGDSRRRTSARRIIYTYEVNNKKYIGENEYFGLLIASNNVTTGGYIEGSAVKVFYNPSNPHQSVLRPNDRHAIWFGFFLAFAFSGFGVIVFIKT